MLILDQVNSKVILELEQSVLSGIIRERHEIGKVKHFFENVVVLFFRSKKCCSPNLCEPEVGDRK